MTPRAWKRLFTRILLWACIVLGLIFLFFLVRATWHVYSKEREARTAHLDEAQQFAELQARQTALAAQIATLDTSRGVEAEVRDRYPVAKSGEEVIVLTDNPNATDTAEKSVPSLWARFLAWFSW